MNTDLGKLGEILLLIYALFASVYMGWWGYILIAERGDLAEKWWETQPQWARKLALIKLPKSAGTLLGILLLISSLIFFVGFCILLFRVLLQAQR
jgi:TRAP-type C4-dicarboxylate transport system permease small subunit